MALIFPFPALRPVPDAAAAVAAVPYDVVSTHEARALAAGNPLSFLHVSRAEIDLTEGTDPYSDAVYERAAENFSDLRVRAPLVEEDSAAIYIYQLHMGAHVQTGVAACFSIDDYDSGVIKKHERTRRDKEDDRTRHILALRAQTGPVFLTYPASAAVDAAVANTTAGRPFFDFVADDDVHHTLWLVGAATEGALESSFADVPALYIADGHHRAASASRARQQLRGASQAAGKWDLFLAVAFPDRQMQVLPYNRIVKDLAGHTPASLVAAIRERFPVQEGPA